MSREARLTPPPASQGPRCTGPRAHGDGLLKGLEPGSCRPARYEKCKIEKTEISSVAPCSILQTILHVDRLREKELQPISLLRLGTLGMRFISVQESIHKHVHR